MNPPASTAAPPVPSQGQRDELAYVAVRDAILHGQDLPGNQLKEESFARESGFSRTPIKHALARLIAEGFAVQRLCAGVFVRRLTPAERLDLLCFRRAIESSAPAPASAKSGQP
ncbi:MAG TPA: GntR family transcriptional regulator [Candidatus Brocadiia bacterium]|nr:GntR family transcriptional regulator [Candidatus Brocadiia bacterium]